jgi:all-trans-8'-apo-beta-carotenal 15,15'-oxygenase
MVMSMATVLPSVTVAKPVTAPAASAPAWLGGLQDLRREHAFEPLRVEDRLPPDLRGTLYRNGPGRFSAGGERYQHWFDGDGALSAVRIQDGRAEGAARVVRTAGLEREERAGRRLFGSYGTPLARPLRELLLQDTKNPANTSVLVWQGRLFATCEADRPYEMARGDLSTLGESLLDGVLVGPFSAHPHRAPSRRATYNFGVGHGRNSRVDVYELPDQAPARRLTHFEIDGLRMNHDFAVTENYLVFAFAPQYLSFFGMLMGRSPVGSSTWRPARGTEIVVVPIDCPSAMRRFHVDAFVMEHVVNAFEDAGELVIDCTYYRDPTGLEAFVGSILRGRLDGPLSCQLRRLRVPMEHDVVKSELLLDRCVELPRVAPAVEARRHRHVYALDFGSGREDEVFGAVLKYDLERSAVDVYRPGPRRYAGEGVFVPRPNGGGEDEGWVLTMVYDADADASALEILDARSLGDGPVGRCWFDHPIPFGFHGAWAPRD